MALSPKPRFALTAALLLGIFAGAAMSKESWVEVRSPNFTVLSNAGDKEARRIADQFEQFRELLHTTMPQLRTDLGKPLIIFAVKNEDGLKALLPAYWEIKGHTHPAGLYTSGEERHFVAVRTNIEGDNPYEVVYHEYTHAIMNLNFRDLPLWLNEGAAEFFGNSTIHDNEIVVGKIPPGHLADLQQNKLIPIQTLLMADHNSPYYNEQNRVSMFYAESWAIVHYLMTDPEAQKRHLFSAFLQAWDTSGDQVQAAQDAFGDLKKFADAMEGYSRQNILYSARLKTAIRGDPKSYASRDLPPAELAAYRAMFYIHTRRPNEAKAAIEEAVQEDPNLPLAYEARGLLAYVQQDFSAAEAAFSKAVALNSPSYSAYYYDAQAMRRGDLPAAEEHTKVAALLEKSIAMNPQFAPAYAALAMVYSTQPKTRDKAFQAGIKAVKLEPGNLNYAVNLGYVLLNAGKTADAKVLVARIEQVARTPEERSKLQELTAELRDRENYDQQVAEFAERAKREAEARAAEPKEAAISSQVTAVTVASNDAPGPVASKHAKDPEYALEGVIASAECNPDSTGRVTLTVRGLGMKFLYSSLKSLQVVKGADGSGVPPACAEWKGKKVRLYFYQVKDKPYAGELAAVMFP